MDRYAGEPVLGIMRCDPVFVSGNMNVELMIELEGIRLKEKNGK